MKTAAKERPILFSPPMVRAILDGRKTQTRRVVKGDSDCIEVMRCDGEPDAVWLHDPKCPSFCDYACGGRELPCPYGTPGDRLWVRETWQCLNDAYYYRATEEREYAAILKGLSWRPGIHMPRAACRLFLEMTAVRVERLQDISDSDAIAEGVQTERDHYNDPTLPHKLHGTIAWHRYDDRACSAVSASESYRTLWDAINGKKHPWSSNPWVWVVEFKRTEAA